jgi:hypothetical protein
MGQHLSLSNTSVPTIGASNQGSTVLISFFLVNTQTGVSTLVAVNDGSGTFLLLPSSFSLQLQNGQNNQQGTFYLGLRALLNGNYRQLDVSLQAISEIFGIVPSLCTYYGQVCSIDGSSDYNLTLYITPTVNANDPVTLLDNLYVREYTFVGNNSSVTANFKYVVFNKSTSCFVVATASVTILCNYSPNGLIQALSTNSKTNVTFDFIFNGNKTTDSYLSSIRPYISYTLLSEGEVSNLNSNAVYSLGQNYMGTLIIDFNQVQAPITCIDPSIIYPCQVGAIDVNY